MSSLRQLRSKSLLSPLFRARDWFMDKSGLFVLKKRIKRNLFLKRLEREDSKKKNEIRRKISELPDNLIPSSISPEDFVISLTSYGKRVEDTLPFALYSLLTQTTTPGKIAVYLAQDEWNDEKLPPILKKLQQVGVEFNYCPDLRSYKKLIPALQQYPDNPIITVDDDFYYNPELLKWIALAYEKSDKKTVLGHWGCIPHRQDGKYVPYNEWKDCRCATEDSPISFFGGAGTCYPPHVFDGEILNSNVFLSLCPTADDIWFWAMEERQGIRRQYISPKGYGYHQSVNRVFDYNVGGDGCLTLSNVLNGENDRQLRNVLDRYKLD